MLPCNGHRRALLLLASFALLACERAGTTAPSAAGQFGSAPQLVTSAGAGGSSAAGLTVPVKGGSPDGKVFHGTLTVTGVSLNASLGPMLDAVIVGTLRPTPSPGGSNSPREDPPQMRFGEIQMSYKQHVDKDPDCLELRVQPGSHVDSETKQTVTFDLVRITMVQLPAPGNLFADLLCTNDEIADRWDTSTPTTPNQ